MSACLGETWVLFLHVISARLARQELSSRKLLASSCRGSAAETQEAYPRPESLIPDIPKIGTKQKPWCEKRTRSYELTTACVLERPSRLVKLHAIHIRNEGVAGPEMSTGFSLRALI